MLRRLMDSFSDNEAIFTENSRNISIQSLFVKMKKLTLQNCRIGYPNFLY